MEEIECTSIFLLVAILISNNKLRKTDSVQSQVNELTSNIKEENEKLRALTRKDILTNIGNKTHFDEQFEKEFKRAIREKHYISMVIVNIDEFKSYNDLYGYEEGNKCLQLISEILLEQCNRPTDLIVRCHSDEFLILLPNTENPSIIARRCVQAVEDLQIQHENSIASNVVTISLGTSVILAEDSHQMFGFLSKARESLKHAKANGRNRMH
jgi:diguanylate cyclase (GGDEF)-like protein